MTPSEVGLYALLARTFDALERIGAAPILVGGLAVAIQTRLRDEMEGRSSNRLALARAVRVTQDADFAIRNAKGAIEELKRAGFQPHPKMPYAFFNGAREEIDLLAIEADDVQYGPGDGAIDVLHEFQDSVQPWPLPLTGAPIIRVATPALLVMLKATAYQYRSERRDLADIGTLALWDVDGKTQRELEAFVKAGRPVPRPALARIAQRFGDLDAAGPLAFASENAHVLFGWTGREEEVRTLVFEAVARLLAAFAD
jgi:hypothetical protein